MLNSVAVPQDTVHRWSHGSGPLHTSGVARAADARRLASFSGPQEVRPQPSGCMNRRPVVIWFEHEARTRTARAPLTDSPPPRQCRPARSRRAADRAPAKAATRSAARSAFDGQRRRASFRTAPIPDNLMPARREVGARFPALSPRWVMDITHGFVKDV